MSKKTKQNKSTDLGKYGFKILGYCPKNDISKRAKFIVKFRDHDETMNTISIPRSYFSNISKMKVYLLDEGYDVPENSNITLDDPTLWKKIKELLMKGSKNTKFNIVARPGFHGRCYLTANNKIIGTPDGYRPFLDPDTKLFKGTVSHQGNLSEWKLNVASSGNHSSRIMTAICSGFSPYLIRWSSMETGGFHLWATSSTGKSTCLYIANSILGPRDSLKKWDSTATALEETATAYCDLLLGLDEIGLLEGTPAQIAQAARKAVYQLTSGMGKSRSQVFKDVSLQNSQRWTTCILSTGESSLFDQALDAGMSRKIGEQVRVVDIPADAGGEYGIFESLPDEMEGNPKKYAELLDEQSNKYYGTAHIKFLKKLTKDLAKDENNVRLKINERMEHFLDKNNVSRVIGHEGRLAKRFALSYAAGISAKKFGILDFSEKEIFNGISKCYRDALEYHSQSNPPSQKEQADAAYSKILKVINTDSFLDIRDKSKKISDKKIDKAKGFIYTLKKTTVAAIPLDGIEKILGNGNVRKKVLERLKTENLLLPRTDGKISRQINVRHSSRDKRHLVCFKLD
jgi:putative DNA primase/helicase